MNQLSPVRDMRSLQVHFSNHENHDSEDESDGEANRGPSPSLPVPKRKTRHTARQANEINIQALPTADGSSITGALNDMKVATHTHQKTKAKEEKLKKRSHRVSEEEEEAEEAEKPPQPREKRKKAGRSKRALVETNSDGEEEQGEPAPAIRRSSRKTGRGAQPRPAKACGRR